jgi:hypothetical protein
VLRYGFIFDDPPDPPLLNSAEFPYPQWVYNGVSFWRLFSELGAICSAGIAFVLLLKVERKEKPIQPVNAS